MKNLLTTVEGFYGADDAIKIGRRMQDELLGNADEGVRLAFKKMTKNMDSTLLDSIKTGSAKI